MYRMLSKKDKNWIKEAIREEFKEALLCEITVEKGPRKPEDLEKHYETEKANVLHFLAKYLPYLEGAARGLQEDVNKTNNKIDGLMVDLPEKLKLVANILIDNEDTIVKLAQFVKMLENDQILLTPPGQKLIEINESDT